jgi:hypothetical protein
MRVRSNRRSCRTGAPILVCVMLLEVAPPKHRLNPEISRPHADNDRIAAIRTNESPPRRNCINHITAAALAENVRSTK